MKRLTELNTARKRWPLAFLVLLAAFMAVSLFVFRHRLPYTTPPLGPLQLPSALMRAKDARIVALSKGIKLWSLHAKTAELSRDRRVISLIGIKQGIVYQDHTPALNVDAGMIRYDAFSGDLFVSHGVCARSPEGQIINTQGFRWNTSRMVLITSGPVYFRSLLGSVTARTLTLDLRARELKLFDVFGRINVESKL